MYQRILSLFFFFASLFINANIAIAATSHSTNAKQSSINEDSKQPIGINNGQSSIGKREAVYVLTERSHWEQAQKTGLYTDRSLKKIGFIHAMNYDEILTVANAFYLTREDLVLIQINPTKLKAKVSYEAPYIKLAVFKKEDKFPHIYGAIDLKAVVKTVEVELGKNGLYTSKSLHLDKLN